MSNELGNRVRQGAQAALPSGEKVRFTFLTQTGASPVAGIGAPRIVEHWLVAVTEREFVVMKAGRFKPFTFSIAFKAPRRVLDLHGKLSAKILLGSATHYVPRGAFETVRAQNAELEAEGRT